MERDKLIDIAKGIGILLSIFGHLNNTFLKTFIYMFHMPLFYCISGYLFNPKKYTLKQYVIRKLKTLILPYFILAFIIMIFNYSINKSFSVIDFIIQKRYIALWFLTSLFFTEIIFYLLNKFLNNEYYKGIIIVILFIAGNVLSNIINLTLPWNIDSVCFSLIYYYSGYLFRKYKENILKREKIIGLVSVIILPVVFFIEVKLLNQPVDIYFNRYGIFPLNIISALGGTFLILRISSYIVKSKYLSKILCYIGENSLIFFGLQGIPISIINKISFVEKMILKSNKVTYCVIGVGELIFALIVLCLINEILRITKIKKIL